MIVNILYILLAIVLLGVLVMVHEFGHYIVGRLTGMTVLEFSIGFGPKLLGWRRKEIDYSLRLIPLGGYCSFLGEDENNNDPRAMNNQPVWRRFLTIFAGPAMNFVFAFVVCVVMLMGYFTAGIASPTVESLYADMPAEQEGLQAGDVIVSANGEEIEFSEEGARYLRALIADSPVDEPIEFTVERDGELLSFSVMPALVTDEQTGASSYMLGIVFEGRTYTLGEALAQAPRTMANFVGMMLDSLKNLVFHGEGASDVTGPVGIISVVSEVAREGFYMVLYILFVISLNLGLMNLLPLPALDGGRLVFLIVEAIRRKPIPPEKEGMVHGVGMLLLLGLILVITYQDIVRLIAG